MIVFLVRLAIVSALALGETALSTSATAAATALPYLATFKKLGVGLWEFDIESGEITKHTTPRETKPLNTQAYARAIEMIAHSLNLG